MKPHTKINCPRQELATSFLSPTAEVVLILLFWLLSMSNDEAYHSAWKASRISWEYCYCENRTVFPSEQRIQELPSHYDLSLIFAPAFVKYPYALWLDSKHSPVSTACNLIHRQLLYRD